MAILFVGWGIYFVYCLIAFRQKPGATPEYQAGHYKGVATIEGAITVFDIALVAFFGVPIWGHIKGPEQFPKPHESVVIEVVAEQFAWNVRYPGKDGVFGKTDLSLVSSENAIGLDRKDQAAKDDLTMTNQMQVPIGKPVLVYLSSKDVIHSFFVPVLRQKQDAIPGMKTPLWFTATQTGEFEIACAQLCGLGHYRMRGAIHLKTPEAYETFLKEEEKILKESQEETP